MLHKNLKCIVFLVAAMLAGCATSAPIAVEYAPRVAGAERILSLSVLDFSGRGGVRFAGDVESELSAARFRGARAVTVVDPSYAGSGFARGVYRGGYPGAAGLVDIGRRLNVDGIVGGSVLDDSLAERSYFVERSRCVRSDEDGNCLEYEVYDILCWDLVASVAARVVLVEVATGATLYNDTVRGRQGMDYCEDESVPYSVRDLRDYARRDAISPLRGLFLPTEGTVRAAFARSDAELDPVATASFEAAFDLARDGNRDGACAAWQALSQGGLQTPSLAYNLGICAERTGDLQSALSWYELALSLAPAEFRDASRARGRVLSQMQQRAVIDGQ